MREFNINNYVKVKLTEEGKDKLRKQGEYTRYTFPNLPPYEEPVEDEEGYSKFQLHSLMYRLGHMCYCGGPPPFHTTILIDTEGVQDL